jgi:dihydrofolate reductase
MRHIANATYMSLDGVVQHPELWTFDYRSDDAARVSHEQLFAADALIMGRHTYDIFGNTDPRDHIGAVGAASRWQLDDVRRHDSGLVILSYRRPEPPTAAG